MKISELNLDFIIQYCNLNIDKDDTLEVNEIQVFKDASISYLKEITGLTLEEMDEKDYLVIPALLLISDMYENKTLEGYKVSNDTFNKIINIVRGHVL